MKEEKRIRIALVYDRPDWVLGEIAMYLERYLNQRSKRLEVRSYQAPQNYDYASLLKIELANDIIHFLSPWDFYRYSKVIAKPSVVTIHHLVGYGNLKQTMHRASAICVPSVQWHTRLKKELLSEIAGVFRTPYGLDCDLFRPVDGAREKLVTELQCYSSTLLLGFAAKMSSDESGRKGLDRLYKVLARLREDEVSFLLLVFGQGWSQDNVPLELQNNIKLMGFIDPNERPSYFSGLDYYLCLSRIEGGPYPVMECMACAVKVISTPVGIVPELISHEVNGFIVEEDNYLQAIPDIISNWSEDSERSCLLEENARASVVNRFSWDQSAGPEIYEPVYMHAVKEMPTLHFFDRIVIQMRLIYGFWRRRLAR